MTEEENTLEAVAKQAYRHAKAMQYAGAAPVYLGVNGMLALMHDSIRRYVEEPTREDLLSLVAHGLHALALEQEEDEWEELEEEEDEHGRLPGETDMAILEADVRPDDFEIEDEQDDGSGRWAPAPGSTKSDLPTYDPEVETDAEE